MNFDNATYQPSEADEFAEVERDMRRAEKQFKELVELEDEKNLDIKTLDQKRRLPISQDDICGYGVKIASLEIDGDINDVREEKEFDDYLEVNTEDSSKALLHYFCNLGRESNTSDMDLMFINRLLTVFGDTDINVRDKHGQSLMHEVAREWSTDIAKFFKIKGIDINAVDNWGRSPLFVAVAANYKEMVHWLVSNGANINQRTFGNEGQSPIHYAAKYDAVEVFEHLVELGADPLQRDETGRTPFYIAAENGNAKICKCFLDWELPTVSYTDNGESTIDQIINTLPTEFILRALNQFIEVSRNTMCPTVKVYLSCLGKRRWRLINQKKGGPSGLRRVIPPTPLEIIVQRKDMSVIKHPAILELIRLKAKRYGNKWSHINILLNISFTVLWITCASIRVNELGDPGHPLVSNGTKTFVFVISVIAQAFTTGFIYKLYREWEALRVVANAEKVRLHEDYKKNVGSCHPRWSGDDEMQKKKLDAVRNNQNQFWSPDGIYSEIFCLLVCCVYFVITFIWYAFESTERYNSLQDVRMIFSIIVIFVQFLKLNRSFQSFQSIGAFISMIGECVVCGAQIFFLFFEFFIPFSVAFWVFFGGPVLHKSGEFKTFQNLLYQLWLLSFIGDYEYNDMQSSHEVISQIMISLYFVLVSIITINIYVALLSESFVRVNSMAPEKAYLAEAQFMQNVELLVPDYKRELEIYITKYCSPMNLGKEEFDSIYKSNDENFRGVMREISAVSDNLQTIQKKGMAARNDIKELQEKLQEVKMEFGEEKVRTYIKELSSLFEERKKPLTKAAVSTHTGISSLSKRIGKLKM